MSEFVAVHMVDSVKVGDRFTMWPLHITLLPWFSAPSLDMVLASFQKRLADIVPFETTLMERAYFGERKLPVMLVRKTSELQKLHNRLLQSIEGNGWSLQGRYTGKHYRPHVTQKAGRDAHGILIIDRVYVAEKQPQGYREIVGKIDL